MTNFSTSWLGNKNKIGPTPTIPVGSSLLCDSWYQSEIMARGETNEYLNWIKEVLSGLSTLFEAS